uniref:(northern house mosquito) hypothetical protein n=1 Tax=Culex pipiens TaxID=7175 RepID=A0A8D8D7J3_CULPI
MDALSTHVHNTCPLLTLAVNQCKQITHFDTNQNITRKLNNREPTPERLVTTICECLWARQVSRRFFFCHPHQRRKLLHVFPSAAETSLTNSSAHLLCPSLVHLNHAIGLSSVNEMH